MIFKRREPPKPVPMVRPVAKNWHAVSVTVKEKCCDAAKRIRNTRYLSPEAPRLPLSQCPFPHLCNCAYRHYADRRAQTRRKEDVDGLRRGTPVRVERRTRGDRRSAD